MAAIALPTLIAFDRLFTGRPLWPLACWIIAVLISFLCFRYRHLRARKQATDILHVETAAQALRLNRCGTALPLARVRALQLLKGVIDSTGSAWDIFQIVAVTHSPADGWQRHLAFTCWGQPPAETQRAVALFAQAIGVYGSCWRIGGWRAPKNAFLLSGRDRSVSRGVRSAPCVEPLDRAARDRAGLNDYDAYAEPLPPPVVKNLCLACGYSLEGLTIDTCPECGTNFIAKPDARG